ncbi:hypothetical protein L1049_000857 [Liquidambar formosana]|uniref:Uncharacterized protein n=1 Tax=Liquidambar formosana TaxID=63359 RepID=A0AAP0NDK1_LIQFO
MMDEYEKLVERSPDGSAKLRVFLFPVSELDSSGMVQFGDLHDNGQRYVDAVNGVMDGVGGGITRKESFASATSTQNSDLSGTEAVDISGHPGQGDVIVPSFASTLSPRGNTATSHDNTPKLVCVEPNPAIYAEASAVPLGIPVVKAGPSQALASQTEVEVERSLPLTVQQQQQLGFDLQQPGVEILPHAPYLQSYMGSHQEVNSCADYRQLPSHMGFPHPQLLGSAGSVFSQQQFRDNPAGVTHQYIPAVHMTMTPSSSHLTIRPNVLQPLMQPQQTRLDSYPEGSTFAPRVVQLPIDQSYNVYQAQVPPAVVGGGYGWPQVPQPEHVVFSDGLVSHQQVMFPEKFSRLEDCYMCQKSLPHAHSDTLVQDQRDSIASPVSESNPVFHSLRLEDNMRAQADEQDSGKSSLGGRNC